MSDNSETPHEPFTPEQVEALHRHQFGPWESPIHRFHSYTCPNRGDGRHFNNGADVGALIPTVRGWICQCCDYTQGWAHGIAASGG